MTERARTLTKNRKHGDSFALTTRLLIAARRLSGNGPALSGASRQLSQRESLGTTKSGAHRWSNLCVPHFVLFCTGRRTRAPRAARRESGANHKPLSFLNRRMEWRNRSSAKRVAGISSEGPEELRLDSTNLAVTTGYHSLSCLSSPDLKIFAKKVFSPKIGHLC